MSTIPQQIYQTETEERRGQLQGLQQKQSRYGWLRLGLILVTAVAGYQVYGLAGAWAWLVVGSGIALFLWVVSLDTDNNRKIAYAKALVHINEEELRILNNDFKHRFTGAPFLPAEHAYAHDLDLFGTHSVYQLLNRCSGEQGRALLAQNLLQPLLPADVLLRQEAINELAPLWQWRQNLQAHAGATALSTATEAKINRWLAQKELSFQQGYWGWFITVYSLLACSITLAAVFDLIATGTFSAFFGLFILVSFSLGRKATPTSVKLSGIVSELETLEQVMQDLEQTHFKSRLLAQLQAEAAAGTQPASASIRQLKALLNRFDLRLNIFLFIFLNSLLLWDVRQLRALGQWHANHGKAAAKWYDLVGQWEVLISLATLRFNEPQWTQPQQEEAYFYLEGKSIGHPLIDASQRVTADFSLQGAGRIALITGSNMAGKSTFLRSLGVNTVLAQMGAPVCAQSWKATPVELLSSMRIADNLAESTSTFYAELKKLKTIIEAVREHRPVFILLDEILRGTNSLDRHTGSKALMGQLLREKSTAVLATHDVELATQEYGGKGFIDNYHFDAQIDGQELYFDYKLKPGVCTNLNASILMRKIGIEL